jgi:hypothetical protein
VRNGHQFDCIVTSRCARTTFCKMNKSDDKIKWFHQHCSSTYYLLEAAMPMVDFALFTIKHIKRLCISHVSNKVMSDFFKILLDYSKAKGNLVVVYIEPITAHLLYLIEDEEFIVDDFMTFPNLMTISNVFTNIFHQPTICWKQPCLWLTLLCSQSSTSKDFALVMSPTK